MVCPTGLRSHFLLKVKISVYLDYADYLVNFQLFFRDIRNLDILSDENLNFVTAKTKGSSTNVSRLR